MEYGPVGSGRYIVYKRWEINALYHLSRWKIGHNPGFVKELDLLYVF